MTDEKRYSVYAMMDNGDIHFPVRHVDKETAEVMYKGCTDAVEGSHGLRYICDTGMVFLNPHHIAMVGMDDDEKVRADIDRLMEGME